MNELYEINDSVFSSVNLCLADNRVKKQLMVLTIWEYHLVQTVAINKLTFKVLYRTRYFFPYITSGEHKYSLKSNKLSPFFLKCLVTENGWFNNGKTASSTRFLMFWSNMAKDGKGGECDE